MADQTDTKKMKRLPKSKRIHTRRVKQEARKARNIVQR